MDPSATGATRAGSPSRSASRSSERTWSDGQRTGAGWLGYGARVDVEDRARVVELIEAVIAADGVVAGEERDFLRRVVQRFGLSEHERADFPVPSDAGRTTAMLRALAPGVQTRVMALLVEAAIIDGNVAPEERALLL